MEAGAARTQAVADLEANAESRRPRNVTRRAALAVALGLSAFVIVVDQLTKAAITARIGPCGNPTYYPLLGENVGFSFVCNSGTAFSRFSGSSWVWLPVGFAALVVGWLWYRSLDEPKLAQQLAFGLILGGAIGNMIDRARLGYVVDFVDLRLTSTLRWYVFNVSDAAISCGVVLLALLFWFWPNPEPGAPASSNAGDSAGAA